MMNLTEQYPYSTPIPKKMLEWNPRNAWMLEQFGPRGPNWIDKEHRYWFKQEADYLLYQLRWL
jgi:hypothetical protein